MFLNELKEELTKGAYRAKYSDKTDEEVDAIYERDKAERDAYRAAYLEPRERYARAVMREMWEKADPF